VHHHKRSSQPRHGVVELPSLDVVEELLLDAELAPGDFDQGFALGLDRAE